MTVVKVVIGRKPSRTDKRAQLRQLKDAGVWLLDLKTDPKEHKQEDLSSHVGDLAKRVARAKADHVVLVKVNVYDTAFARLRERGLPVVDERIHFPSTGRQADFEKGMKRALKKIGWRTP